MPCKWGIIYFIAALLEYINVEGALCLVKGGIKCIIQGIVEYINMEVASRPGNEELYVLLKLL